jgi:hypothetical protein
MALSVDSSVQPDAVRINTVVQQAAAVVCAASAGVHATLVPAHLQEGVAIGAAFVLSVVLLGAAALRVRTSPVTPLWIVAVLAGVAGSYALSRTTGLPGLIPKPEPVDVVGALTSLAEAAAAVAVLSLPRSRKETR